MVKFEYNHYNWFKEHGDSEIIDYIDNYVLPYTHCELEPDFLDFLEVYLYAEKIISSTYLDRKVVVVDVGCNAAVQQFFFRNSDYYFYIGINPTFTYEGKSFLPKAIYKNGLIINDTYPSKKLDAVLEKLKLESFGISSYCLTYAESDPEVISTFTNQFPRHLIV